MHRTHKVQVGQLFFLVVASSEAAMFMGVADREMLAKVIDGHMVQLYNNDGSIFSSPITIGEAGVFYNHAEKSYYYHEFRKASA